MLACPICHAPVAPNTASRPFCSTRCQKVDLGHWLGESYRISSPAAFDLEPSGASALESELYAQLLAQAAVGHEYDH